MSGISAISGYPRSDSRNGSRAVNGIQPSPGLPPNDYGRPQPKTFQSNTIVPNKSTMIEDDDDPTGGEDNDDEDAFGLESAARSHESKKDSSQGSEVGSHAQGLRVTDVLSRTIRSSSRAIRHKLVN
jgi:hypothetical protein